MSRVRFVSIFFVPRIILCGRGKCEFNFLIAKDNTTKFFNLKYSGDLIENVPNFDIIGK